MINVFEPKIEIAVNEYLGIKNEVPLTEVNGLSNVFYFTIKFLLKII